MYFIVGKRARHPLQGSAEMLEVTSTNRANCGLIALPDGVRSIRWCTSYASINGAFSQPRKEDQPNAIGESAPLFNSSLVALKSFQLGHMKQQITLTKDYPCSIFDCHSNPDPFPLLLDRS